MHKDFFITGTDTGVGKTFIAVGLLEAMKEMGLKVCPMKPVETGCETMNGRLLPADSLKLICAAEADEPLNLINPYRFKLPLAPAVAAELEGVVIEKKKILSAYRKLSERHDITIVEGAGGLMVPVYKKYFFADLIKELDLPLIIVSKPGLGTVNHTLLTIEAARSKGITVIGVIINCTDRTKNDISVKTNPVVISRVGKAPVLGMVTYTRKDLKKVFRELAVKILSRL